jgi:SAM-dependent methyltransferase
MAARKATDFLGPVADYYMEKLASHGATARGVDWNSEASQALRFAQLCRVIQASGPASLNDVGCGYGELCDYLQREGFDIDYLGVDIAPAMIAAAQARARQAPRTRFAEGAIPDRVADYSVASGIFNVRLSVPDAEWRAHILAVLDVLNACSSRGFAFNCLSSYADAERKRPELYYADPLVLFDHCKRRYSREVALLHDYGLYEFTMIVRKGG